jgi:N-acetylneuraminic acid mutarotase
VVNRKIYAIGGTTSLPLGLSTVEEFAPATDTWTKKADMPTGRCSLSAIAVNGYIYAIGGRDGGQFFSTVEAYDTGFRAIEAQGKLPTLWGKLKVMR